MKVEVILNSYNKEIGKSINLKNIEILKIIEKYYKIETKNCIKLIENNDEYFDEFFEIFEKLKILTNYKYPSQLTTLLNLEKL